MLTSLLLSVFWRRFSSAFSHWNAAEKFLGGRWWNHSWHAGRLSRVRLPRVGKSPGHPIIQTWLHNIAYRYAKKYVLIMSSEIPWYTVDWYSMFVYASDSIKCRSITDIQYYVWFISLDILRCLWISTLIIIHSSTRCFPWVRLYDYVWLCVFRKFQHQWDNIYPLVI